MASASALDKGVARRVKLIPFVIFGTASIDEGRASFSPRCFTNSSRVLSRGIHRVLLAPSSTASESIRLGRPIGDGTIGLCGALRSSVPATFSMFQSTGHAVHRRIKGGSVPVAVTQGTSGIGGTKGIRRP